ncbi:MULTISPECIES: cobalamin biosynthesis protein [unclassified Caballeronia]|uniref:cobalamin biosynthesis protein n=1 Tax=unclassified Caballeronia TaxID=2646786 RepID=UPI00286741AF|nr:MULTISPECIES: cobalamin biosynthesis protein [unclassified Caballeronia]MDR5739366.1 cobalamin biosynthesis protein [Caballeronia sp. LZ016]MDR5807855.1 cobalamin biosynthesis protein [Caballeronia sp. LZ019]
MMTISATRRHLAVGIGCRRGASADAIEHAVRTALDEAALSFDEIALAASIDAKECEAGLLAFCERHRLALHFFNAEEIAIAPVNYSRQAARHMNVDGVCEPCAILASGGGRLALGKTIVGGVTVAIAMKNAPSDKNAP